MTRIRDADKYNKNNTAHTGMSFSNHTVVMIHNLRKWRVTSYSAVAIVEATEAAASVEI